MEPRYVKELAEGSSVSAAYALRSKELREARNGDLYLSVRLADRSGSMAGVYFRPRASAIAVPVGTVVQVTGVVTSYRGSKRITVSSLEPSRDWDAQDFVPEGLRPVEELVAAFKSTVATVKDPVLAGLLRAVFSEHGLFDRFAQCPGSQTYHHAYLGGLIEHTLAVATICDDAASRYDGVDRDMIVTAALLHDLGKVDELAFDTAIEYTDEGRLAGHVVLGIRRLERAATRIKMPTDKLMRLEHAVLSHHGELEWGSPKRPSTIEALILHHADNLDAKASGFSALLTGALRSEETWTDASNLFHRPLYAPRALSDDRPGADEEDASQYRLTA